MKAVNLFSLTWNHASSPIQAEKYLALNGIKMRAYEFNDLIRFVNEIYKYANSNYLRYLDHYYVSYVIPQIHKEFDLLRFGENYNINIELKSENTGQAITEQLIKNRYYLKALETKAYYFTYVSSENKLYQLIGDVIEEISINVLCNYLGEQIVQTTSNIDGLFDPTKYLISPFNTTGRFIEGEYFLTEQQLDISKKCLEGINQRVAFFSIEGGAGTGKTLLTYDIAKKLLQNNKEILLFHCGILNKGHHALIKLGWDIKPIKDIGRTILANYQVIFIDEAQRIYLNQLRDLIDNIKESQISCIFSYDKQQYLGNREKSEDVKTIILNETASTNQYKLTDKIRSNKEIADFIRYFFAPKRKIVPNDIPYHNITLHHFSDNSNANYYAQYLMKNDWTCINYTPSKFTRSSFDEILVPYAEKGLAGNTHEVIGQEFDNVAVLIDNNFYYKDNDLKYRGRSHYFADKMLFQMMTRARKKLSIILVDNEAIYTRCIDILSSS